MFWALWLLSGGLQILFWSVGNRSEKWNDPLEIWFFSTDYLALLLSVPPFLSLSLSLSHGVNNLSSSTQRWASFPDTLQESEGSSSDRRTNICPFLSVLCVFLNQICWFPEFSGWRFPLLCLPFPFFKYRPTTQLKRCKQSEWFPFVRNDREHWRIGIDLSRSLKWLSSFLLSLLSSPKQ